MSSNSFNSNNRQNFHGIYGETNDIKNHYRLVILGGPKVGKTSIVNWFLSQPSKDCYIPTIESFHIKIFKIRGEIFSLDILDTSGNDPFPAMKKLNIMTGDFFLLVFSLDDIDSYIQMKQMLKLIFELKRSKTIPILIIGNKLDNLIERKILHRCFDTNELQQILSSYKSCIYSEVSCKNFIGIDLAFQKLFAISNLPKEMSPSKHRRLSVSLDLVKSQFGIQKDETTTHFFDRRKTFKKSIRKLSFKNDAVAVATLWLNARRPSIRAELTLLKVKPNRNFIFNNKIYNHYKTTEKFDSQYDCMKNRFTEIDDGSFEKSSSKFKSFFLGLISTLKCKSNKTVVL